MNRPRSDVKPMDKTDIGPQADADVGPISLPPSARFGADGQNLHRPAGGCPCWADKFAALGPMLGR